MQEFIVEGYNAFHNALHRAEYHSQTCRELQRNPLYIVSHIVKCNMTAFCSIPEIFFRYPLSLPIYRLWDAYTVSTYGLTTSLVVGKQKNSF